jgi:hypothetical protein
MAALVAPLAIGCSHSAGQSSTSTTSATSSTGAEVQTAAPDASPQGVASTNPESAQTQPPSVSISDKNGTVKSGQGAVDPSTLGVPLFPGAAQSQSGGNFSESDANGSAAIATLDANAGFDVVDAWYKSHVPPDAQATHFSVGGEATSSYEWASKDGKADRIVTINTNHGKPVITISMKISNATPGS